MNTPNLTEADIDSAVRQLRRSARGGEVIRNTLAMLDAGGIGLDSENQRAVMTLLYAAFTDWPGYTRDAMRAVSERRLKVVS